MCLMLQVWRGWRETVLPGGSASGDDLPPWKRKQHLRQVLTGYLAHYNTARPHRALGQLTPAQADACPPEQVNLAEYRIRRKQSWGDSPTSTTSRRNCQQDTSNHISEPRTVGFLRAATDGKPLPACRTRPCTSLRPPASKGPARKPGRWAAIHYSERPPFSTPQAGARAAGRLPLSYEPVRRAAAKRRPEEPTRIRAIFAVMHGRRYRNIPTGARPELDDLRDSRTGKPMSCARASMPYGPPEAVGYRRTCTGTSQSVVLKGQPPPRGFPPIKVSLACLQLDN